MATTATRPTTRPARHPQRNAGARQVHRPYDPSLLPELETWVAVRTRDNDRYTGRLARIGDTSIRIRYGAGFFLVALRDIATVNTPADPHPAHRDGQRTRHHGNTIAFAA